MINGKAISTCALCLSVMCALLSCTLSAPPSRVIYEKGRTVVQLETDPSAGAMSAAGVSMAGWNAHPVSIKPVRLASLLREVRVRSSPSGRGALLNMAAPAEAVFTEEEIALLAPRLADGLTQASATERVGFVMWGAQPGRRSEPLSGHVAVRESYLRFGLNNHPTVGWQDPADSTAPKLFELEFAGEQYLLPGSEAERKATARARPLLQIDYRRYLASLRDQAEPSAASKDRPVAAPAGAVAPAASAGVSQRDAVSSESMAVKDLQRQVNELTDSNQELRVKLRDVLDRQDQSRTVTEELAKLRQELAETKQLLADKVLELNRLKNKSSGSGTGKK